jgi:hypothetical protein
MDLLASEHRFVMSDAELKDRSTPEKRMALFYYTKRTGNIVFPRPIAVSIALTIVCRHASSFHFCLPCLRQSSKSTASPTCRSTATAASGCGGAPRPRSRPARASSRVATSGAHRKSNCAATRSISHTATPSTPSNSSTRLLRSQMHGARI